MDNESRTENATAAADPLEAVGALVTAAKAALADLRRRIPGGLSPLELVEESRIEQAGSRLLACAEELALAGVVVRGSMGQQRPHPLLKLEQELRREIVKSLRELVFRAESRASAERLHRLTSGERP